MTLCADELSSFISEPKSSIPELINATNMFGDISGYSYNWTESGLVLMGDIPSQSV